MGVEVALNWLQRLAGLYLVDLNSCAYVIVHDSELVDVSSQRQMPV